MRRQEIRMPAFTITHKYFRRMEKIFGRFEPIILLHCAISCRKMNYAIYNAFLHTAGHSGLRRVTAHKCIFDLNASITCIRMIVMPENEQLKLLDNMLEQALSGNYSYRIDTAALDEGHAQVYEKLCRLLEMQTRQIFEVQAATGKIMSFSEDLTADLEESGRFSRTLYTNADQIGVLNNRSHEHTASAVSSMKELIAHLADILNAAESANVANSSAGSAIGGGMKQVYHLIDLIGAIETATSQTVKQVENFQSMAEQINAVLRNVDNIARQTEILSFNATIEARRAGQAGVGFNVIADAIRDLAGESKQEVATISEVVNSITGSLESLSGSVRSDYDNVIKSVDSTKTIETSLTRINETYSSLSGLIGQIAQMTSIEDSLAGHVSAEIEGIESDSLEVTQGFGKIYDAIGHQKSIIENLNSQGRFLQNAASGLADITSRSAGISVDAAQVEASAKAVLALLTRDALSYDGFMDMSYVSHKPVLDGILKGSDRIEAVWSNDAQGRFIYSNPVAGILNARARDWFRQSIAGKTFISEVYVSAITKKPCVTVSMPIRQKDGTIAGVIGADLKIA